MLDIQQILNTFSRSGKRSTWSSSRRPRSGRRPRRSSSSPGNSRSSNRRNSRNSSSNSSRRPSCRQQLGAPRGPLLRRQRQWSNNNEESFTKILRLGGRVTQWLGYLECWTTDPAEFSLKMHLIRLRRHFLGAIFKSFCTMQKFGAIFVFYWFVALNMTPYYHRVTLRLVNLFSPICVNIPWDRALCPQILKY